MAFTRKLIYDMSASGAQTLVTQFSGAVVFYLLSDLLPKGDIGIMNWSLAVLMIVFAILGFGIDQLTVGKIAKGGRPEDLLGSYLLHIFFTGSIAVMALIGAWLFLGSQPRLIVFAGLLVSQLLIYCSLPFKQVASGQQRFRSLFAMSVMANMIRVAGIAALVSFGNITVVEVVGLYVLSSFVELLVSVLVYRFVLLHPLRINWRLEDHWQLVRDSLPQLGVIFFTALLSRIDWVLLGCMCSIVVVAEYSFAYRCFELCTFPLLVAGQLLLPRIAGWFSGEANPMRPENTTWLKRVTGIEIRIAVLTILVLNICWSPVIDLVTHGKYGAANRVAIGLLSLCIPLLYINNILWSLAFGAGKLRSILRIFFISACINLIADMLLIHFFKGTGAAIGFLLTVISQTLLYLSKTDFAWHYMVKQLVQTSIAGALAWLLATKTANAWQFQLLLAAGGYLFLLWVIRRVDPGNYLLHRNSLSLKMRSTR